MKALLDRVRTRTIQVRGCPAKDILLKDEGDRRLVEAAVEGDATHVLIVNPGGLRALIASR